MKNTWYGDKRDLVKWSVLIQVAQKAGIKYVIQAALYREDQNPEITISNPLDEQESYRIQEEVMQHFRDCHSIRGISNDPRIIPVLSPFNDRKKYFRRLISRLEKCSLSGKIVFLDPDTGLQPSRCGLEHVSVEEAMMVWMSLKAGDIFGIYQHKPQFAPHNWKSAQANRLANALQINPNQVCYGHSSIASDVMILFAQKSKELPIHIA